MEQKNKKKKIWKKLLPGILSGIVGGIGGFVAGYFGFSYLDGSEELGKALLYFFAGSCIAFYLQLILHEAGHLVFGLLSGYRFVSFRIGSFTIYKKKGKIYFGKYSIAGTGGQCLMAPPDMKDGKMPYRLYNLGGVIMNVVISGISFVLYLYVEMRKLGSYTCIMTAVMGFVFAATNGIPMRLSGIDNDGFNALSLGKNIKALHGFWLQLKINEMLTEGKRLKDMPEEWFEKPSKEETNNSMIAAIAAIRCNRLLDSMEFETANQEISEVIDDDSGMIGVQKVLLQIDQVFCEIFGEKREEILNQMKEKQLVKFMKAMKRFPSVIRTRYAYALLIENDEKKAGKFKKQFEKMMKKHPYQGEVESEWELIRYCEQN